MLLQETGRRLGLWLLVGLLGLGGCAIPQVSAEDRLFRDVSVTLLDHTTLPDQSFEGTTVGGLSALAYDRDRDVFYALSDDRADPRFYTLALSFGAAPDAHPTIASVRVIQVTHLQDETGHSYAPNRLDPEGLALSPRGSVLISSEGVPDHDSPPALNEYDLTTGQLRTRFRLPDRYLPDATDSPTQGIRSNQGLEALTLNPLPGGATQLEPFRLFTATESALAQDYDTDPSHPLTNRFLHYLIGQNQSTLISEHAYPLSLEPMGAVSQGLTELLALDQGGHFLALERVYGLRGFGAKLFQLATGGATDTSAIARLNPLPAGVRPIQKRLLLDFADLDQPIDNLEGMALGPPLPDGSDSLWIVSDNNFSADQRTQIWLFRLQR